MGCFGACSRAQMPKGELVIPNGNPEKITSETTHASSTCPAVPQRLSDAAGKQSTVECDQNDARPVPTDSAMDPAAAANLSGATKQEGQTAKAENKVALLQPSANYSSIDDAFSADESMTLPAAAAGHPCSKAGQRGAMFAEVAPLPKPVPVAAGSVVHNQQRSAMILQALQFPDTQLSPQSLDPCQVSLLLPSAQQSSQPFTQFGRQNFVAVLPGTSSGFTESLQQQLGQQQLQQQSERALPERSNSMYDIEQEDTFRWDYVSDPSPGGGLGPGQQSKDFLGQRASNIRRSLDVDFSNAPMLATRRSKDYGEPDIGARRRSVDPGRSH